MIRFHCWWHDTLWSQHGEIKLVLKGVSLLLANFHSPGRCCVGCHGKKAIINSSAQMCTIITGLARYTHAIVPCTYRGKQLFSDWIQDPLLRHKHFLFFKSGPKPVVRKLSNSMGQTSTIILLNGQISICPLNLYLCARRLMQWMAANTGTGNSQFLKAQRMKCHEYLYYPLFQPSRLGTISEEGAERP